MIMKNKATTTTGNDNNNNNNKVSKFLLDPWSTVKVVLPSAAVQLVIHQTLFKKASLRELTLGLTLLNTIWFATTLNLSYLETPLVVNVPSLNEVTKLDVGRHRFNWINKIEATVSLISLDLYLSWNERIINHNGFVDNTLKLATLAPVAITVFQSLYLLPKFNRRAAKVIQGEATAKEIWDHDPFFLKGHRAYITLDTVKIAALAVAGLRFGLMLKN
ncbi:uncharacterized protein BX663DRAFT_507823 [Cokeromyces recurvatus]|uniref:uncharacterized protein n=1 Tax=Cokeromyces recurvatus TaxID=90255 RepID=UPI00221F723C|nr:uncharacterized protein BX663DRAFT_507823 [Cokeromyces recurvatus]KAI7903199.1 hypothetical protein BX663DRAFT_507823 [Cokeromyces recurvatus]